MVRWVGLVLMAVAVAWAGVLPAQAQGRTWTVVAGGLAERGAVLSNAFHPRVVDVEVGDTVVWTFEGFHNVAFAGGQRLPPLLVTEQEAAYLNPEVAWPAGPQTFAGSGYRNSGVSPEDPKGISQFRYALRFTQPGTYTYSCVVHGPAMSGVVRVHPRGSRLPEDPEAALRRGRKEQQATLMAGRQALDGLRPNISGRTARVSLLGDGQRGFSLMRFTREPLRVRPGTTVTWEMRDPFEVHTVTFTGPGAVPAFVLPQAQPAGPPKLLLNPRVMRPAGGPVHMPGYLNSGLLTPMGAPGPKTYSLRFDRAGTYTYWCPVHAAVGMKGVVVVR